MRPDDFPPVVPHDGPPFGRPPGRDNRPPIPEPATGLFILAIFLFLVFRRPSRK